MLGQYSHWKCQWLFFLLELCSERGWKLSQLLLSHWAEWGFAATADLFPKKHPGCLRLLAWFNSGGDRGEQGEAEGG